MNLTDTLFVAGHRGMVGSAIVRRLQALGCTNILTAGRDELDLTDQHAVNAFFAAQCIDQAYLAAAKVGGSKKMVAKLNAAGSLPAASARRVRSRGRVVRTRAVRSGR